MYIPLFLCTAWPQHRTSFRGFTVRVPGLAFIDAETLSGAEIFSVWFESFDAGTLNSIVASAVA